MHGITSHITFETCEKCGDIYMKPHNSMLPLPSLKNICPKCRTKSAVDKGKRILDIITER